jgi:hypothetical protein
MKVFYVKYDSDDQLINIPNDVEARVNKLKELRTEGYTHVEDKWYTMYTGQNLATISSYIIENESYL